MDKKKANFIINLVLDLRERGKSVEEIEKVLVDLK